MLRFVLVAFALLCNIYFQVHFSYNCLCFSELYILFCIALHFFFVAGSFSFLCAHVCMCCFRLFTRLWYRCSVQATFVSLLDTFSP